MEPVILVVDDEKNTRELMARALETNYLVVTAADAGLALKELEANPSIALMLSDIRMPGTDGISLMRKAKEMRPDLACILLTAYGSVDQAVAAMKDGADDFLTKPVNLDQLELRVEKSLKTRNLQQQVEDLRKTVTDRFGLENIVGNSAPMQKVFQLIRHAAPSDATILIQGPSGTGKELVAHAVHNLSNRKEGPFIAVECAALNGNLLESELFGHEKGAFTDAITRRIGRFEAADHGTIFLDEISEIPLSTQVKLLRVLQTKSFERIGSSETIKTDIRIIAATNRDLKAMVAEGRFREDLYYRLNVVDIHMPPLKDRTGDIALIASRMLQDFSAKNGGRVTGIDQDAMRVLEQYSWPGNVRELGNIIEKMVVLSSGGHLTINDIPEEIRSDAPPAINISGTLQDTEKEKILAVLKANSDNRTKAAEALGISRRTLHRRLREWGLIAMMALLPCFAASAAPQSSQEEKSHDLKYWAEHFFIWRNDLALIQAIGEDAADGIKAAEGIKKAHSILTRCHEPCPVCKLKREIYIQEPDVGQYAGLIGPRNRLKKLVPCPVCKAKGRIAGYRNASSVTALFANGRQTFETKQLAHGASKQGLAYLPSEVENLDICKRIQAEIAFSYPCSSCNWSGAMPCRACRGEGVVKCKGIGCKDGWVVSKTNYNSGGGRKATRNYKPPTVTACRTCQGVGLVVCNVCNGARQVPCSSCGGEGIDRRKVERAESQLNRERQRIEREAVKQ